MGTQIYDFRRMPTWFFYFLVKQLPLALFLLDFLMDVKWLGGINLLKRADFGHETFIFFLDFKKYKSMMLALFSQKQECLTLEQVTTLNNFNFWKVCNHSHAREKVLLLKNQQQSALKITKLTKWGVKINKNWITSLWCHFSSVKFMLLYMF